MLIYGFKSMTTPEIIKSRYCLLLSIILLLPSVPVTGAPHSQFSPLSYFDPVEQQREIRLHRALDTLNRPETSPTEVRHSGHFINGSGIHGISEPDTEDNDSTREGSGMALRVRHDCTRPNR